MKLDFTKAIRDGHAEIVRKELVAQTVKDTRWSDSREFTTTIPLMLKALWTGAAAFMRF